jgi:hypothetical protein
MESKKAKTITTTYFVVRLDIVHDADIQPQDAIEEVEANVDYNFTLDSDSISIETTEICGTTEEY